MLFCPHPQSGRNKTSNSKREGEGPFPFSSFSFSFAFPRGSWNVFAAGLRPGNATLPSHLRRLPPRQLRGAPEPQPRGPRDRPSWDTGTRGQSVAWAPARPGKRRDGGRGRRAPRARSEPGFSPRAGRRAGLSRGAQTGVLAPFRSSLYCRTGSSRPPRVTYCPALSPWKPRARAHRASPRQCPAEQGGPSAGSGAQGRPPCAPRGSTRQRLG